MTSKRFQFMGYVQVPQYYKCAAEVLNDKNIYGQTINSYSGYI
jgi:hypothetical protein